VVSVIVVGVVLVVESLKEINQRLEELCIVLEGYLAKVSKSKT